MKRFLLLVLILMLLPIHADCVSTQASSAILMDFESGRILYGKDIHQPRLIASTTKLMTALVAVEYCRNLDTPVVIQAEWVGIEGSSIYLNAGETVSFRELLYGMLLHSGNDAAAAIACWVAGDEDSFAVLMNQKAAELGMVNSSFANASGLNQEGHYSTAYDMALLASACLRNDVVAEACSTRSVTIGTRTFVNHNKLLDRCDGCIGMKTGYTERAGRTLVSAAERNGQTLICVTLNDSDDWNDHEKLYEYGFANYPQRPLCQMGSVFGTIPVVGSLIPFLKVYASCGLAYPLTKEEVPQLQVILDPHLEAPVAAGMVAGTAIWTLDGKAIAEVELICFSGAGREVLTPSGFKICLNRENVC